MINYKVIRIPIGGASPLEIGGIIKTHLETEAREGWELAAAIPDQCLFILHRTGLSLKQFLIFMRQTRRLRREVLDLDGEPVDRGLYVTLGTEMDPDHEDPTLRPLTDSEEDELILEFLKENVR